MNQVSSKLLSKLSVIGLLSIAFIPLQAQEDQADSTNIEEITVIGSQIKGAKITGSLPVSIISSEDIDALGIESGEELLENIAENGMNNFNQSDFNGGYNANRGDVGALNLRNLGTGNTLTLLNGRRIVNAPSYATEWVGGSYIPVLSVNSNVIPVYGTERIEILRDGASAIYGADAIAGVVNTVLKDDYEGLTVRLRQNSYDNFDAKDEKLSIQWGKNFSDGSNISVYFDHYDRERIQAIEDPKWANGDLRRYLPDNNSDIGQFNDTTWRNASASSQWAQFYENDGGNIFSMYMPDDSKCGSSADPGKSNSVYTIPGQGNMCLADTSSIRDNQRAHYGQWMDKRGDLKRSNILIFYNTTLSSGIDAYTEVGYYTSDINRVLYPGTFLGLGSKANHGGGTQPFLIPATNYWVQQLTHADGSSFVDANDVTHLWGRYYRFQESRGYDSKRETIRLLQGFSGNYKDWSWDTAVVWSEATSDMDNFGRVSYTKVDQALALTTSDAFNPFCAGLNCNDEQVYVTIARDNKSELFMWDFKMSNPAAFTLRGRDIGVLVGAEIRREEMTDVRDPRINGTIQYTSWNGTTFPYLSDIVNSSPSPNTNGDRTVTSLFAEMQIPLGQNADAQLAIRSEDFDDIGNSVVGKFALGWQIRDRFKFRASTSTSFRAPNLVTVNEGFIVRSNSLNDPLLESVYGDAVDTGYSIQRAAQGNADLESEEATNYSVGFVIEPFENMIVTIDRWSIKTENTVGLFGEINHLLLDTLIRKEGGASECTGNPLVIRAPFQDEYDDDGNTVAWDASLCPAGFVNTVMDTYINLDDRTMEGTDYAIQYSLDTEVGKFSLKFVNVSYDKFYQEASGPTKELIAAANGGALAGLTAPRGYEDLIGVNGRPGDKYTLNLAWKYGPWEVFLSGTQVGAFLETGVTDNDYYGSKTARTYRCAIHALGTSGATFNSTISGEADRVYAAPGCGDYWPIGRMTTSNLTLGYKFKNGFRVRGQVRNFTDERAPLADEYTWGAWSDIHSDYGRSFAIELYKKFD